MTRNMSQLLRRTASPIVTLPRRIKQAIACISDMCLCILATLIAFFLRLDELTRLNADLAGPIFLSIFLALPIFAVSGLYREIFRHSGWPAIAAVGKAMMFYGVTYSIAIIAIGFEGTPRTVGLIQPLILFFALAGSRIIARLWLRTLNQIQQNTETMTRALIYGAGSAGQQLAIALKSVNEMVILGFLDDDDGLCGHVLNGFSVFRPTDLPQLIKSKNLTHILLAIPSASRARRNEIIKHLSSHKLKVRTLPSIISIARGRVKVSDIRDLDLNDLLGRQIVRPNRVLMTKNITQKVVCVTGAGGSIGGELCRQILNLKPTKLILIEISEFALYTINSELATLMALSQQFTNCEIVPLLGSVQDENRMREIIEIWKPNTIYHAAAYKHVPLVEHNLAYGVRNNVLGTLVLAKLAIEMRVGDFVLISTDKAVRPTNAMGATKRIAEMCLQSLFEMEKQSKQQALNFAFATEANESWQKSTTKFSIVRFGNVLDSSGSVIPRFRKQIQEGGPLTLTHPEITRYFMTIPEAAELVIQAGSIAHGGEVFVLDMGEPIKIADLASSMIELSGLSVRNDENPDGDIEIVVTGLRPGEKLYEELLIGNNPQPTQHSKIWQAHDSFVPWGELEKFLNRIELALEGNDTKSVVSLLAEIVTEFRPNTPIVDYAYLERTSRAHADASDDLQIQSVNAPSSDPW